MAIETIAIIAGVVLILPWTLKHTGDWNKVKKWYNYVLSGVLIGFISTALGLYSTTSGSFLAGTATLYLASLLAETIALALGIIGIVGICKGLLSK